MNMFVFYINKVKAEVSLRLFYGIYVIFSVILVKTVWSKFTLRDSSTGISFVPTITLRKG